MSSMGSEKVATATPRRSRLAFLKTKRAIAFLTALVIVAVVLIALGATHVLTPHHKSVAHTNPPDPSPGSSGGAGSSTVTSSSSTVDNPPQPTPTSGGGNGGGDNGNNSGGGGGTNGTITPPPPPSDWKPKNSSTIADGTPLRIMCLGASIVRGEFSSDSNGFRKTMREDLAAGGATINMVGSQRFGDMLDNDLEAYGGNRVSQVYDHATHIVPDLLPNVYVINVGTNNALQRRDVDKAGQHMEAFVDYLLKTSPRSTVIMSTLITNTVPGIEPMILDINEQFRSLFARKYTEMPVVLAELHPAANNTGRPQAEDIGKDGSHPTDKGYEIMGHLLAEAVKEADSRGYLRWPAANGLEYNGEQDRGNGVRTTTELPPSKPTKSVTKKAAPGAIITATFSA
ncbi:SGNH hydrolase-type esterase domain-containing protein [Xylariaceae sp. FL0594]|nr:SGNH hydrolase-type esterase domain-containing protein [Xylariaceae sp. FL0594]